MKYFSTFSGIGGFEIGIHNAWRNYLFIKAKDLADVANNPKPVGCIIVKDNKIIGSGSNSHEGYECKRAGYPTGVGYELCEGCQYGNHAEIEALEGIDAKGADLYLYGHYYLCESCSQAAMDAGIRNVYIKDTDGKESTWSSNVPAVRRGQETTQGSNEEGERLHPVSGEAALLKAGWVNEHFDISSYQGQPHCVGFSEIDRYASSVYSKHFKGVRNYGDITKINATELPDFDCLVGGFPCQAFSVAGKRKGFEDTRGTLFFDLARILKAKRPRLFVFENVKGLLSHDSGNTFRTIISTITELGYDAQWQVLNSKDYGVPQNRERIVIVGHLRGERRPEVFPFGEAGGIRDQSNASEEEIHELAQTQTARQYASWNGNFVKEKNNPIHSNNRIYDPEGLSPTLNTMQGGNRQPKIIAKASVGGDDRYLEKDVVGALKASNQSNIRSAGSALVSEGLTIRRLTPVECERLQGFPDNWTSVGTELCSHPTSCPLYTRKMCSGHDKAISDSQRYKMCGNAVTTNVFEAVFTSIFLSLDGEL